MVGFRSASLFIAAASSVFALSGVAVAQAETGDYYLICTTSCSASTGTTQVTATSSRVVFTSSGVSVTCTHSTTGAKPPARSAGLAPAPLNPLPVFNDGSGKPCAGPLGSMVTTSTNGKWTIGFVDSTGEVASEPNSGDRMVLTIPQAGSVAHVSPQGCTITTAPMGAIRVSGAYSDGVGGKYTFTINASGIPGRVTGPSPCPDTSPTSTCAGQQQTVCGSLQATYVLTPGVRDAV